MGFFVSRVGRFEEVGEVSPHVGGELFVGLQVVLVCEEFQVGFRRTFHCSTERVDSFVCSQVLVRYDLLKFSQSITTWHTTESFKRRHCNVGVLRFDSTPDDRRLGTKWSFGVTNGLQSEEDLLNTLVVLLTGT